MDTQKIAEEIADKLMTYYTKSPIRAKRMVMEFENGKKLDGPGLNKSAIVGRVKEILDRQIQVPHRKG